MSEHEFIDALCVERGISVYLDVRARVRTPARVKLRHELAIKMREAGYSLPEIGRAMGRHHTTVLSLLRGGKGKRHGCIP